MVWRRAVLAAVAVVAAFATETRAEFACPDGQFPVSVLDNPQIQCLTSRPCSGVYGPEGLVIGVGACPSGTGCALLPHNPSVMGCVNAGRDDVSYVNPDGSLTRGGKVISGPPTSNNDSNNGGANNGGANNGGANNSTTPTAAPTSAPTKVPTPTTTPVSTTTDPGHVKPGGDSGSGTSEGSVTTTTPASPTPVTTTNAPTTTTPTTSTTNQQALDDITGEIANNQRGVDTTTGLGFGSIIAIVVGCLAVVAIIAGVFVLRKKKEQSIGTPEGALEDYGAGGVTPKENVLLL